MRFLISIWLLIPFVTFSQSDSSLIYENLYVYPEYPGGPLAMKHFIACNFMYPENEETEIAGTVWLEYNIDTLGIVDSVVVKKGLSTLIDAEAKRVVELFPNHKPGTFAGKKQNFKWSLPIKVKLEKPPLQSPPIPFACYLREVPNKNKIDDKPIIVNVGEVPKDEEIEEKLEFRSTFIGTPIMISPEYPGGFVAMLDFIDSNFVYPPKDTKGTLGTVYVEFNIDTLGVVDSVKVIKGLTPVIDAEAKRVVELFPNFIPGNYMGKKRNEKYTIPIKIKEIPKVYDVPFVSAEFPGGFDSLAYFIYDNLDVGVVGCGGDPITGVAWIQFYVSKYGYISNVTIRKGVQVNFDKEAVRVIEMMPNWIPAQNEAGENVPSYFTIPIKKHI